MDKLNDEKDTKQLRIINIDKSLDGYQIVWQFDDSPSLQILSILVHKYETSKISRHLGCLEENTYSLAFMISRIDDRHDKHASV